MIAVASAQPVGNTGLNSQISASPFLYGFDWLNLIIPIDNENSLMTVLDFVADSLGDAWEIRHTTKNIGRDWSAWARSCRGAMAGWNRLENGYELMLSLNGNALAGSGGLRPLMRLFSYLCNQGARANRIDAYADDHSGRFARLRPLIESAVDKGQQVGFRDDGFHWSRKNGVRSETYNLGSRSSQSYHRIYDKEERVRWEREIKDSKAHCLFTLACKTFECLDDSTDFSHLLGSLIRDSIFSSIDFIDRKDKNLKRGERLDWWQEFLDSLEVQPLKLASTKRVSCFHRMRDWVDRSVAKVLARLKAVFPDFPVWMGRLIKQGEERLTSNDAKMIEAFLYDERESDERFYERMREREKRFGENDKRFYERINKYGFGRSIA